MFHVLETSLRLFQSCGFCRLCYFQRLAVEPLIGRSFIKAETKRSYRQEDLCFVHQTKVPQTLEENVKAATTERLFRTTPPFSWHLTQEVGKKQKLFKVTHESCHVKLQSDTSPHFISPPPFNSWPLKC